MNARKGKFDRLRRVLAAADRSLTAREVFERLREEGLDDGFESPHTVATVLGRRARRGEIEVIAGDPYRYRLRG
jgi:hypothetical protein